MIHSCNVPPEKKPLNSDVKVRNDDSSYGHIEEHHFEYRNVENISTFRYSPGIKTPTQIKYMTFLSEIPLQTKPPD